MNLLQLAQGVKGMIDGNPNEEYQAAMTGMINDKRLQEELDRANQLGDVKDRKARLAALAERYPDQAAYINSINPEQIGDNSTAYLRRQEAYDGGAAIPGMEKDSTPLPAGYATGEGANIGVDAGMPQVPTSDQSQETEVQGDGTTAFQSGALPDYLGGNPAEQGSPPPLGERGQTGVLPDGGMALEPPSPEELKLANVSEQLGVGRESLKISPASGRVLVDPAIAKERPDLGPGAFLNIPAAGPEDGYIKTQAAKLAPQMRETSVALQNAGAIRFWNDLVQGRTPDPVDRLRMSILQDDYQQMRDNLVGSFGLMSPEHGDPTNVLALATFLNPSLPDNQRFDPEVLQRVQKLWSFPPNAMKMVIEMGGQMAQSGSQYEQFKAMLNFQQAQEQNLQRYRTGQLQVAQGELGVRQQEAAANADYRQYQRNVSEIQLQQSNQELEMMRPPNPNVKGDRGGIKYQKIAAETQKALADLDAAQSKAASERVKQIFEEGSETRKVYDSIAKTKGDEVATYVTLVKANQDRVRAVDQNLRAARAERLSLVKLLPNDLQAKINSKMELTKDDLTQGKETLTQLKQLDATIQSYEAESKSANNDLADTTIRLGTLMQGNPLTGEPGFQAQIQQEVEKVTGRPFNIGIPNVQSIQVRQLLQQSGMPTPPSAGKLASFLMSKGYSPEDAKKAAQAYLQEGKTP